MPNHPGLQEGFCFAHFCVALLVARLDLRGQAIRRWGGAEELRRALLPLAEAFKRWEHSDLDSGELSDLIHRFHQGPAGSCQRL